MGPSWSWSYGSWIYNYLCNKCLSPLTLWVWILLMARCTRNNIMWYSLSDSDLWQVSGFSTGPPVSSTNKTDRHEITEIVLKVALNTTKPTPVSSLVSLIPSLGESVLLDKVGTTCWRLAILICIKITQNWIDMKKIIIMKFKEPRTMWKWNNLMTWLISPIIGFLLYEIG